MPKKIVSVGQEVLPEASETATTLSEASTKCYSEPFQQPSLPGTWYKERVYIIRRLYPELSRHIKTKRKSLKDVYNEYLKEMSLIPTLGADVIKERELEKSSLEELIKGMLEEE
jgi:hypothetical protein